jgi:hypothetical protein
VAGCQDYLLDCQSDYSDHLNFDGPVNQGSEKFPAGSDARDIVAALIDGDTNLDVAVLHAGGVSVFVGDGQGEMQLDSELVIDDATPHFLEAADLDGDGTLDFIVFCDKTFIHFRVFLNNSGGLMTDEYDLSDRYMVNTFGTLLSRFSPGDIHGDGDIDFVYLSRDGQASSPGPRMLVNQGDGSFVAEDLVLEGYDQDRNTLIGLGDFNGDGLVDLTLSHYPIASTVDVFLADAQGGFSLASANAYGSSADTPVNITSGDYNSDGLLDIRTLHESCYDQVFIGLGDGTFQPARVFHTGMDPTFRQAFGDFNADGNTDIAVSGYSAAISYLINGSDGLVQQEYYLQYYGQVSSEPILAAGDLNNDCIDDVIFAALDNSYNLSLFTLISDPCDLYQIE